METVLKAIADWIKGIIDFPLELNDTSAAELASLIWEHSYNQPLIQL